ncbi:MAG: hypothetical protein NVS9B10_09680 [Nevskia sp.]
MAEQPYLIKKYSSRRLYDVAAGGFITLADLYALIRSGRRIKAVDAKGRDITRSVLLQILAEQEESGQPLLSVEVLHEMVRMYGSVMQSLFMRFLDAGVVDLLRQQQLLQGGVQAALKRGTTAAMAQLLENQTALWQSSQKLMVGLLSGSKPAAAAEPAPAPPRKRRR